MFFRRKLFYLRRHPFTAAKIIFGLILFLTFCFLCSRYFKQSKSVEVVKGKSAAQSNLGKQDNLLEEPLTFLVLGLDSRKGDYRPRCDAIHLITFSPPEDKVIITSVPRGVEVDLEGVATASAYLGNSCHIKGIDFAMDEIERITSLQPDYLVKINFSQALGVLRILNLPTTPALQFLRDRRSYFYGDNQRSHNQAVFLKDMMVNHLERAASLPRPMKRLIFKMVEVEGLDFSTGEAILNWLVARDFSLNPDKIELVTKPSQFQIRYDVHFEEDNFSKQESWQNDQEFQDYQEELRKYLEALAKGGANYLASSQKNSAYELLKTPFSQQLWLQLEDDRLRHQLHFDLLEVYVLSLEDKKEASSLLQDFKAEMEIYGEEELKNKAEELLASLS